MKKSLQFLYLSAAASVIPSPAAPLTYPKAIPVNTQDQPQDKPEELTATGDGSSTLVFPQVGLSSRVEHYPARTQTLMAAGIGTTLLNLAIVPAADGTITAGQTYDVVPSTAEQGGPSVTPNSAEVLLDATPKQPLSRSTWRGAGGTVTIIGFTRGSIAPGKPGVFQVRFNDVKMVPTSINPGKSPFVLTGPLVANTGGTPGG